MFSKEKSKFNPKHYSEISNVPWNPESIWLQRDTEEYDQNHEGYESLPLPSSWKGFVQHIIGR